MLYQSLAFSRMNTKCITSWTNIVRTICCRSHSNVPCSKFGYSENYKVVIVGGGSGGATMAAKLGRQLGKNNVAVLEPSEYHFYQPYWTLVGGGIKDVKTSQRTMASILPKYATWLKCSASSVNAEENTVKSNLGNMLKYDVLIIAVGLELIFEKITGLTKALGTPGVCSNYSRRTVMDTKRAIEQFQSGNAIFTQPINPIKCAGAPQKIMYLAEDSFRKSDKRDKANIMFYTALDKLFSAPKYAAALRDVAKQKGCSINYSHNLVEVRPETKEAVFHQIGEKNPKDIVVPYELLHVTPPMRAPEVVRESPFLADSTGFLDVDKLTLQHKKYPNVFGIGDCTNLPTSKTAAAVAGQSGVVYNNVLAYLNDKPLKHLYDGYTSCPLVTGNSKGILAEFDYDLQPLETLPFDQGKERYLSYIMKKELLPFLYWNFMLRGYWSGPSIVRKILHFGLVK